MARSKAEQTRIDNEAREAIERLRELCPPGTTIYSAVRSVSRSGMSRTIDFFAIDRCDGGMLYLTGLFEAANAGVYKRNRDGALKVGGCGMDMCFSVVYNTATRVWRDTPEARDHERRNPRGGSGPGYMWRSEVL